MLKEIQTITSAALGQDMTHRVYGTSGKPVVAFPTSQAHENLWEDFGMVDVLAPHIESGAIQLFAVDSIDDETFYRTDGKSFQAIYRYEQYLRYISTEFMPQLTRRGQKPLLTGCSMGAYHAANIYFRNPTLADSVIALSGVYSPQCFLGFAEFMPSRARANSPLDYLQGNLEPHRKALYERANLVFCAGQGSGEEDMLADTVALGEVLDEQGINAWVDVWGADATHDWPWWHQQMSYFLPAVLAA